MILQGLLWTPALRKSESEARSKTAVVLLDHEGNACSALCKFWILNSEGECTCCNR